MDVCARMCVRVRSRLGTSGGGSRVSSAAGAAGLAGWGPGAPTWSGLQPAGPGEEGKYPCCCSLPSPPTLTLTPPFEIKRKKKAKKKNNNLKTSECKVPDQAQPGTGVSLCPARLQRAIPKSAPRAACPGTPCGHLVTLFLQGCPSASF